MPVSPDTGNYQYGAGVLWLKVDGIDTDFRHVGNAPKVTYSPTFTDLDHKQSMSGLKSVDDTITTEVAAELDADLEEVTPENMQLFVAGSATTGTDGEVVLSGLTLTNIKGYIRFVSDNAKGRDLVFEARVSIRPNGAYDFITDGLNKLSLKMKILQSNGMFGQWIIQPA